MPYRLSTFFWGGTLLLPTSVIPDKNICKRQNACKFFLSNLRLSIGVAHFWPKKPNAESEILSGYFSQNIPSDDFRFGFKSNWHGQNWKFINFAKAQSILKANFLVLIWTMEKSIRLVFLFNWEQEICFMN